MTTPNDPNLRSGSGGFERVTNAHQRRLLSAYDSWSIATRRLILAAINRGIPQTQLPRILFVQLAILTTSLIEAGRVGITAAIRVGVGRQIARTSIVAQTALRNAIINNTAAVTTSLVPGIQQQLAANILADLQLGRNSLNVIFTNQRYRVANYAGGAWAAIFEVQKEVGEEEERVTGVSRRVKWELHELADHCSESPGFHGCPDVAKIYDSFRDLPTVPAGQVTCRGNCVLPGQLVQSGGFEAAFRSWYSGPVLELFTKKGLNLTITPNHPILTPTGWQPANLLNEGSNILSGSLGQHIPNPVNNDNNQMPTLIEDIWGSLAVASVNSGLGSSFVVMPHDFHGDGRFMDGNVDIVRADGQLLSIAEVVESKIFQQLDFSRTHLAAIQLPSGGANVSRIGVLGAALPTLGASMQVTGCSIHSVDSEMGITGLVGSLLGRHSVPFDFFRFALGSHSDSVLSQYPPDYSSADLVSLCQSILGIPLNIGLDKVVGIRHHYYSGHVYDLQCLGQFYTCNNIFVHNCRCRLLVEDDNGVFQRGLT